MVILLGYLNKMGRYAAIDAERTFKYRGGELTFSTSRNGIIHFEPFKCQFLKMVKHTQTIRRQFADKFFECVWPFCRIGP